MFFFLSPLLLVLWFMLGMAETNWTPFDFSEGEIELVSGFNTEYGGSSFALVFMAEYASIIFLCSLISTFVFCSSGLMFYMMTSGVLYLGLGVGYLPPSSLQLTNNIVLKVFTAESSFTSSGFGYSVLMV